MKRSVYVSGIEIEYISYASQKYIFLIKVLLVWCRPKPPTSISRADKFPLQQFNYWFGFFEFFVYHFNCHGKITQTIFLNWNWCIGLVINYYLNNKKVKHFFLFQALFTYFSIYRHKIGFGNRNMDFWAGLNGLYRYVSITMG